MKDSEVGQKGPVTDTASPENFELNLSYLTSEGLVYGLGNDDTIHSINENEVSGLSTLTDLSQVQFSSSPVSSDSGDLKGICHRNVFPTTATTTTKAANESLNIYSNTFNNTAADSIVNDINVQLEDYNSYYNGKELQLSTLSPLLQKNNIITATTQSSQTPPSELFASAHFTAKQVSKGTQQAFAVVIIDMIYAYPRMMTRRETLPPFVHANSPIDDSPYAQEMLPQYLANCMGIAQLIAARSVDTHSFIWTTILTELRGFRNNLHSFNKYDVLSALQASLLYLIIRAGETTPPHESTDDYLMLSIYQVSFDPFL
jgi:hypothetical protein